MYQPREGTLVCLSLEELDAPLALAASAELLACLGYRPSAAPFQTTQTQSGTSATAQQAAAIPQTAFAFTLLTSAFLTEYIPPTASASTHSTRTRLLRALRTSACTTSTGDTVAARGKESVGCPLLEVPNMISTPLPSALFTACEVHSVPCVLYVLYTDYAALASDTLREFEPCLLGSAFSFIPYLLILCKRIVGFGAC